MRVSPGWLLLPVCRALVVPKEVSGRLGETLSIQCWYPRGYESYSKYWCHGASRDSCRKVAETAPGASQPHGRVTIADIHLFCVVLLTMECLAEQDAGTYWCGIERLGRDLMEPVTVTVLPDGTERPNTARVATQGTSSAGPTTTIVVPTVVLVLLAAAGSAVIWILVRRRREAQQRPAGDAMCLGQLKVAADPQAPGNAQLLHSTARAAAAADGDVYSNSLAEGPWDPSPPPPHRAGATSTGTEREPVPQDEQLYENTLYENTRRQKAPGSQEETGGH